MEGLLALIAIAVAIAALAKAMAETMRSRNLSARLDILEERQRLLAREIERVSSGQVPASTAFDVSSPRREAGTAAAPAASSLAARAAPEYADDSVPGSEISEPPPVAASRPVPAAVPPAAHATASDIRRVGIEERLGTRWAVWVGGVALALGALLLVRYSIEQGIFGPGVRLMVGGLFATALVAAGEWLRRSETRLGLGGVPSAHIPGILTAAGTVAAFGTVYAAHANYGYLGPAAAFAALGIIGIATMMAAGLHGPALAGLGLAGSFLTPALISTSEPSPWPLVVYLGVAAAAAYALAARRRWRWLALAAAAGGISWGLLLCADVSSIWIGPVMAHALLQLAMATWFLVLGRDGAGEVDGGTIDWPVTGVLAVLAALAAVVIAANAGVSVASIAFTAAATAMLAAAALRQTAVAPAIAAAGGLVVAKLVLWPSVSGSRVDPLLPAPPPSEAGWLFSAPLEVAWYVPFALVTAIGVSALAAARLMFTPSMPLVRAAWYAATAALLPLAALVVGYLRISGYEPSLMFALAGIGLAGLFAAAALAFEARETDAATPAISLGTGTMASAAVAALALALMVYLDRGYLIVALAIAAFATAGISHVKSVGALRLATGALGLVVLARLVADPRIMGDSVGTTPILNWLLLGYGVPAAAFFGSAHVLERTKRDKSSSLCWALAIVFAALLVFFQIRHLLNEGDVLAGRTDHVELGLMLLMSIGFAYVLMRSCLGEGNDLFRAASMMFGGLSAGVAVLGLLLIHNPLLSDEPVLSVGPVSSLWLAYLTPALGAALLARHARGTWPEVLYYAAGALAMTLAFAFVSLEVRHAYQGGQIGHQRETTQAEFYSYSAAWLLLGVAMLAYGLWRRMPEARLASAVLVLVTVLKVFLWDLSGLEGPWRAFSFIGLGIVLVGIGMVYQRLVFSRDEQSAVRPA